MNTEFHHIVKRLEDFIAGEKWDRAEAELKNAYGLQPQNPYLAAYAQRIASLADPAVSAGNRSQS
jgi:hypothetical protein